MSVSAGNMAHRRLSGRARGAGNRGWQEGRARGTGKKDGQEGRANGMGNRDGQTGWAETALAWDANNGPLVDQCQRRLTFLPVYAPGPPVAPSPHSGRFSLDEDNRQIDEKKPLVKKVPKL